MGGKPVLYTYFRSSAAYRVRIALAMKGIAYDSIAVNLLKGDHKADAYAAVNPQGRVPTLESVPRSLRNHRWGMAPRAPELSGPGDPGKTEERSPTVS